MAHVNSARIFLKRAEGRGMSKTTNNKVLDWTT